MKNPLPESVRSYLASTRETGAPVDLTRYRRLRGGAAFVPAIQEAPPARVVGLSPVVVPVAPGAGVEEETFFDAPHSIPAFCDE